MNKILIALLAGFAAGILLAPHKGSVTRKKLSDGFDDLSNNLSNLIEKFTPDQNSVEEAASAVPKMKASV